MITSDNARELRELVRQTEARLGVINEMESLCCGVSFTQCHAITAIGRAVQISLNDLAKALNVDNSTMSRTVNTIVNKGLANRVLDPKDRRYVMISLTREGKIIFDEITQTMDAYFKKIFENIPGDKRNQVLESLQLLINAITSSVDPNEG